MDVIATYGVMGYVDENGILHLHYPISVADLITYKNSKSRLNADNTQDAIDELDDDNYKDSFDALLALGLLSNAQRQNEWEIERGTVTLTNTEIYPFNNSQISIPLAIEREGNDYVVHTDVVAEDGNAGEIVVSDKLSNGFKLKFTGSATSVTVKYAVIGGYLK
jgi:hypothetical protein